MIIPTILEKSWEEIEKKFEIYKEFARAVHIDFIDGKFTDNTTFLELEPFNKYSKFFDLEAHLMVENPIQYLDDLSKAGFKTFLGHIEKMNDQVEFVAKGEALGGVGQLNMEEISYAGGNSSGKRKLSKRLVIFGGLFLLVLLLLGSAVYFITQDSNSSEPDETASTISLPPEEEITETPTPEEGSPTPEKSTTPSKTPTKSPSSSNNSDVSIAVQNGSGVSGAAAEAAEVLKAEGFTIASTGNADTTDYSDVTIRIKNSQKASLADIEEALSDDYTIGETSTNLPENTSYDVLVIIGS